MGSFDGGWTTGPTFGVWKNSWDYWIGPMFLSLLTFDIPWLDIMCLAMAVTLLEGAVTGRGTTRGRH
jgi:hypothetical protein